MLPFLIELHYSKSKAESIKSAILLFILSNKYLHKKYFDVRKETVLEVPFHAEQCICGVQMFGSLEQHRKSKVLMGKKNKKTTKK